MDIFQQCDKIYVVVAVLVLIYVGLTVFLFSIDRKITKLEKQINVKNEPEAE